MIPFAFKSLAFQVVTFFYVVTFNLLFIYLLRVFASLASYTFVAFSPHLLLCLMVSLFIVILLWQESYLIIYHLLFTYIFILRYFIPFISKKLTYLSFFPICNFIYYLLLFYLIHFIKKKDLFVGPSEIVFVTFLVVSKTAYI